MNSNPPGVQEFRDDGEGNNFLLGNSSRIGKVLIYGHRNTISIGERCRIAGQIVIKCNDGPIGRFVRRITLRGNVQRTRWVCRFP